MEKNQDEKLVTYCGLYCGDCFGYQGKIASLAGELQAELENMNFKRNADHFATIPFFKALKNYDSFVEILKILEGLNCKDACREGGGPPFCEIRKCCQKKDLTGCWECNEFETCKKLNFLNPVHGDAHLRNLNVLQKDGVKEFINGDRCW